MARTKYSYQYKGQIVRNSNRLYAYGLVNENDKVIACSGTEQGALKQKVSWLNHLKRQLEWCKKNNTQWVSGYETEIAEVETWHTVPLEVIERG